MNKFLIVPMGETFRDRFDGNRRGRGSKLSYDLQMKASESHIQLIKKIKKQYGYETDVFYHFYSLNKEYDQDLVNLYEQETNNVFGLFTDKMIGEENYTSKTCSELSKTDTSEYISILFLRVDFYIKKYFHQIYDCNDSKILFAHPNEIHGYDVSDLGSFSQPRYLGYHIDGYGNPLVNHMMIHVPNKFFEHLFSGKIIHSHDSYSYCLLNGIEERDIWFMIDTYHSSNSSCSWNPIFHLVGRPETKEWPDRGYRIDPDSRKPYFLENDTIYQDLKDNDFYS